MKYLALLVLGLLIIGCTETTPTDTETPTENPTETPTEKPADAGASDAKSELSKFFNMQTNLQWKITYDITSSGSGADFSGSTAQYFKNEKMRMDMTTQGMETRTYIAEERFTTCTRQDEWKCYEITPDDTQGAATEVKDDFEEQPDDYEVIKDGTKTVINIQTQCYRIVQKGEQGYTRYCISKDGVPLYIYTEVPLEDRTAITEMTATSYSKSVSDSDFVPPAEAQDIGSMYGAGGTSPAGGDACAYCDYLTGEDKQRCLASC